MYSILNRGNAIMKAIGGNSNTLKLEKNVVYKNVLFFSFCTNARSTGLFVILNHQNVAAYKYYYFNLSVIILSIKLPLLRLASIISLRVFRFFSDPDSMFLSLVTRLRK